MSSINTLSREFIGVARGGIGFIILWKEGRSWNGFTTYDIEYNEVAKAYKVNPLMVGEFEAILDKDPKAIAVNSYYDNIGGMEDLTQAALADGLRYQYEQAPGTLASILSEIKVEEPEETEEPVEEPIEAVEQAVEEPQPAELPAITEERIKKPALDEELARKVVKEELEAAMKKPPMAMTPQETHEKTRTATNWMEVIKSTSRTVAQATGQAFKAGKELAIAAAPKAKLILAAVALMMLDLMSALLPVLRDAGIVCASWAWGFATDTLPTWARYTAVPTVVRAYRETATATEILAYMARIALA